MMKALCFALVAALCFGMAFSLQCYSCTTTGNNCLTPVTCNATLNETSCRSEVTFVGVTTVLKKVCGSNCSDSNIAGTLAYYTCCKTDLCNKDGLSSGGVRTSNSGLSLALGVSAILFRAVL